MAGKKKFSYYNDYSTVNFGGSSGRTSRKKRTLERSERPQRESAGRPPCKDCDGTAKCLHCKDGFYPRRDGSNAQCGKCRGSLKCHACRGRGTDGRDCGTPRYEATLARVQKEWARRVTDGVITAALGAVEIALGPGLADGALSGQQDGVGDLAEGWKNSARMEQRDRQTRGLRRSTHDKGVRDRGSSQQ